MNLNDICGIDAFLIESCPAVVLALCLLPLKLTFSTYQAQMWCVRRLDIFHFRIFFFTEVGVSASKHSNKTTRILLFRFVKQLFSLFASRIKIHDGSHPARGP
jgi:hypothetical protein